MINVLLAFSMTIEAGVNLVSLGTSEPLNIPFFLRIPGRWGPSRQVLTDRRMLIPLASLSVLLFVSICLA